MIKEVLQLNGSWQFKEFPETARRMRDLDTGGWMPATVPSTIYTCLAQAGQIQSADLIANPENYHWISQKSWIFRKEFDAPDTLVNQERFRLIFEGLDTVAHVWLNGKLLGKVENMFIPHIFDVTDHLKPSANQLYVKFLPALQRGEQLMQRYGKLSEHHFGDPRRCYLRKAQYQFGSAVGPALPGCGIFRSVRLVGTHTAHIDNLHVRTVDCNQHRAAMRIAVRIDRSHYANSRLQCKLTITGGGLNQSEQLDFAAQEDQHAILASIDRPILWWPRGYGVPHLYHLKAELFDGSDLLDTVETDFGIRTIRLNRTADERGRNFQLEMNGQPVYIKGANWLPLPTISTDSPFADYSTLLKQAANAHINMLRIWGGGIYEDDAFYQQCDKLGILIWQDFMFANAYYPDRQWFVDIVRSEARAVIERLRNHPSLALWCGNSRIDSLHEAGRLGTGRKFFGKAIFHELLGGLLSELDPDRDYIPTTPFTELPQTEHNAPSSGTTHCWGVWNHYAPAGHYEMPEQKTPRFITECGLQSVPNTQTVATFDEKKQIAPGHAALEQHNYQPGGNARIARYTADHFAPSENIAQLVYQSQLSQARSLKRLVEHLRTHRTQNAGCLLWTLNDTSPSISFSVIDACGHPKAVYYYARRFFAPVLLTLSHSQQDKTDAVRIINDSPNRITATLQCTMMNLHGQITDEINFPVALSPRALSSQYILPKSFAALTGSTREFLTLSLDSDTETLAENTFFFAPDKYLRHTPATIEMEIHSQTENPTAWTVTLHSKTPVRDVCLIAPEPGQFSDNFFTLLPGQTKKVTLQFDNTPPRTPVPIEIRTVNSI
ncbi:MAG: beta-mannosidase [Planctomycetota bacterium]|jgi:beta-mannosidase